jgi:ribosomal-protein-alanine N-acetyltransferase
VIEQSTMAYFLRPMKEEDLEQVEAIEREAFPTLMPSTSYRRELKTRRGEYIVCVRRGEQAPATPTVTTPGVVTRLLHSLGIDLNEHRSTPTSELIVGFVGVWFMAGEAHIVAIAVREASRGQGVGELLLQTAVEIAVRRRQEMVTLEVRVTNTPAQKLYEKYGFQQVGIRKRYYSDNHEDAFIMTTGDLASDDYQHQYAALRSRFDERYGEAERTYS